MAPKKAPAKPKTEGEHRQWCESHNGRPCNCSPDGKGYPPSESR